MMDPALKIAMALCVLLMGVCAAMLFRRDRPAPVASIPCAQQELSLRSSVGPVAPSLPPAQPTPAVQRPRAGQGEIHSATVVTPSSRYQSPPPMATDYPETRRPASSRWGASMEMMLPMAAPTDETAQTHTVVDGDTLPALADRYLGSAALAQEIFQANRDVLSDPNLLPIGVELKLPPRRNR